MVDNRFRRKKLWRLAILVVFLLAALGSVFYARPLWFFGQFQRLQLRLAGVKSDKVVLHGQRIHYYVWGAENARPIVLVHGLGGHAEDWIHLAPYLVKAGYRVYTPDLLGFGQSAEPADASYSIADQAALVTSFFDAMHLGQTDLVGWSMGGWIVQKVAADHPERIGRLVLMDSAGLRMAPDWDTRLFTPTTAAELDRLDALLMPAPPKIPGFLASDILRVSEKSAWVVQRALGSMLTARDVMDAQLPGLKMPVLMLWGDKDRITPLSEGRAMHALVPQSRLVIAEGCGHLAPEQCSERFGPEMVRFLQADPALAAGEAVLRPGI